MIHGLVEPLALSDRFKAETRITSQPEDVPTRAKHNCELGPNVTLRLGAPLIAMLPPYFLICGLRFKNQPTFAPQAANLSILTGIELAPFVRQLLYRWQTGSNPVPSRQRCGKDAWPVLARLAGTWRIQRLRRFLTGCPSAFLGKADCGYASSHGVSHPPTHPVLPGVMAYRFWGLRSSCRVLTACPILLSG